MSNPWEIADQAQRMLGEAANARTQVAALLAETARRRDDLLGVALWCSMGEHSFGQQDLKRATFTIETMDEETGAPITEKHLMCGPCAAKRRGALQLSKEIQAPATAPKEYAQYMKYLEEQAGEGA